MLPHLRDRPLSFLRYPDGPDGAALLHQERAARHTRLGADRPGAAPATTPMPAGARPGPALADVGGEPGGGVPHPPVAAGRPGRGRPAGLRPGPRRRRPRRRVLRGRPVAARAAGARTAWPRTRRPPAPRGCICSCPCEPTAVRGVPRRTRSGWPVEAEDALPELVVHRMTRGAAARQGVRRLQPERRREDHRRPYTLRAKEEPDRLHARHLGRDRGLRDAGGPGVPRRGHAPRGWSGTAISSPR